MRPEDSFGLVVFNDKATVIQPLRQWKDIDNVALEKSIMNFRAAGGTSISKSIEAASKMFTAKETEKYIYSILFTLVFKAISLG